MEKIYKSLVTDIGKNWPDLEILFSAKNEHQLILTEKPFLILELSSSDSFIQLKYALCKAHDDDLSYKELVIKTDQDKPYYFQYENSQNGDHIPFTNSAIINHLETAFTNYISN